MSLGVGDKAPLFSLPSDDGGTVALKDLKGQNVVLYFYPKDDTSGCTAEACAFRDALPDFSKVKATVLGVSRDSVASHDKFKTKYKLPFPLLCDTTKAMSMAYGAAADASAKYPDRVTYVLAADGTVESAEKVTDIAAHVDAAVAKLRDV